MKMGREVKKLFCNNSGGSTLFGPVILKIANICKIVEKSAHFNAKIKLGQRYP